MATRQLSWFPRSDFEPTVALSSSAWRSALHALAAARRRGRADDAAPGIHVSARDNVAHLTAEVPTCRVSVAVPGTVTGSLATVIPWSIVDDLPTGPVVLRPTRLQSGDAVRTWRADAVTDVSQRFDPPVPGVVDTLDAAPLRRHLQALLAATARLEDRPILTGILIEPLQHRAIATDGQWLVRVPWAGSLLSPPYVLSGDGLRRLLRVLGPNPRGPATWQLTESAVWMAHGPTRVAVARLTGRFPDSDRLFPEHYPVTATAPGDALASALIDAERTVRPTRDTVIQVTWDAEGLLIETDRGFRRLVAGATTPATRPAVSARFSSEVLVRLARTLDPGPVVWSYPEPEVPVLITQGAQECLVLPLRAL